MLLTGFLSAIMALQDFTPSTGQGALGAKELLVAVCCSLFFLPCLAQLSLMLRERGL